MGRHPPKTTPVKYGQASESIHVEETTAGMLTAAGHVSDAINVQITTVPPDAFVSNLNVAVILVNKADDVRQLWTTSYINQLFNGPGAGTENRYVAKYFTVPSWNRVSFNADVYGWYVLATTYAADGCAIQKIQEQGDAAATADGVTLSNYTHKIYMFPNTNYCNFSGSGPEFGNTVMMNFLDAGTDIAFCQKWKSVDIAHELGHNLGIHHAGDYICTQSGTPVTISDTCVQHDYLDPYDMMGAAGSHYTSNLNRLILRWTPRAKLVTITSSGDYTITPANDQASSVYRVCDGSGFCLYFENRAEAEAGYPNWPSGNLLVRRYPENLDWRNPAGGMPAVSQLLDCSPLTAPPAPYNLPVGNGFTWGSITIENTSWDGTNNVVQIGGL